MHDHRDPWKWPFVIGVTLCFWLPVVFLVPRSWYDFFFTSIRPLDRIEETAAGPWLTLMPPPEIQVIEPEDTTPPEKRPSEPIVEQDPDWWIRGQRIRIVDSLHPGAAPVPTARDTMHLILHELGITGELTSYEKPDSLLTARLILLEREDSFRFDNLKPYLYSVARSRDYADIMSRAADMYDEFLGREIMVPD